MTEQEAAIAEMVERVTADGGDGDGWIQTDDISGVVRELMRLLPEWKIELRPPWVLLLNNQEYISVSAVSCPHKTEREVAIMSSGVTWKDSGR